MLSTLEEERNEIRLKMRLGENYNICIQMCKNHIKKVQQLNKPLKDTKEDLWFGYYNQSWCDKKIDNIREAYINAQKSIQYTDFDINDYKYSYSLWMVGSCTLKLDLKDESITIFKECSKIYKEKNDERFRAMSLFNIALSLKNTHMMLRIIKVYNIKALNGDLPTYGHDMQKDEILQEMYSNLIKIYILNNDYNNVYKILHTIKNTDIKKEVCKLLVA